MLDAFTAGGGHDSSSQRSLRDRFFLSPSSPLQVELSSSGSAGKTEAGKAETGKTVQFANCANQNR